MYEDRTSEAGLAVDSRALTGWGMVLADLDLDGHLDLLTTNGHIRREPSQLYPYENPPILWRNWEAGDLRMSLPEQAHISRISTWAAD